MEKIWADLDKEYGNANDLAEQITKLHNFQVSKQSKTDAGKFMELYNVWRDTYAQLSVL